MTLQVLANDAPRVDAEFIGPALDLDAFVWRETGDMGGEEDPRSRLNATMTIGGLSMHVEAWEVGEPDGDGIQRATNWRLEDDLDAICERMGVAFQTVTIQGREYVLIITPHCI